MFIVGCAKIDEVKNEDNINYISFSADGKKLLFYRHKNNGPCQIQVYDLKNHELCAYQSPSNEMWTMARYSFDGNHIIMSVIPFEGNRLNLGNMQIAIMDPDGKNFRKITNSYGTKIYPTPSHSGDKIIYAKAASIRKKGRTPAADYDIYEVDIGSGEETRLTWLNIFSFLSPPFEFPDGETIIFSAYGVPGLPDSLDSKDNSFIVKKGDKKRPYPFVIPDGVSISNRNNTRNPLVSMDGKHVYFQALAMNPDGIHGEGDQYYEYFDDGAPRRITSNPRFIRFTRILSAALSPDNKYLASICDNNGEKSIVICNVNDSTCKTIILPDYPSYIINQIKEEKAEQFTPPDTAMPRR